MKWIYISDHVILPNKGYAAMESWGIAMYGETVVLEKNRDTSVWNLIDIGSMISHETAHMVLRST